MILNTIKLPNGVRDLLSELNRLLMLFNPSSKSLNTLIGTEIQQKSLLSLTFLRSEGDSLKLKGIAAQISVATFSPSGVRFTKYSCKVVLKRAVV